MKKVFKDHGVKYGGALIAVIAVAIVGILVYVYEAIIQISSFSASTLPSLFPMLMYILMYYSIIKYVFDFFRDGSDVSISEMITRYCTLTAVSTITGGTAISYALLVANTLILVFVPSVKDSLGKKKAVIYALIVLVLAIIATVDKVMTGGAAALAAAIGPIGMFAETFNLVNPAVQWALFLVLMIVRGLQPSKADKE